MLIGSNTSMPASCSPLSGSLFQETKAVSLVGTTKINNELMLDPPMVLAHVKESLASERLPSTSYTLQRLNEKKVNAGEGGHSDLRGTTSS